MLPSRRKNFVIRADFASGAHRSVGRGHLYGRALLCGSYSASVDLQRESADMVFSGALPVEELISHRFPLNQIHQGIERALHPDEESLKIVVQPQR